MKLSSGNISIHNNSNNTSNPSVPVVQNILLPLVELLYELVSYQPNPNSLVFTKRSLLSIFATNNQSNIANNNISSLLPVTQQIETDVESFDHHRFNQTTPFYNNQYSPASISLSLSGSVSRSNMITSFQAWLINQPYASFMVCFTLSM